MSMPLIAKELAEAVMKMERMDGLHGPDYCPYCEQFEKYPTWLITHTPECIVTRARLLLELEWGVKHETS